MGPRSDERGNSEEAARRLAAIPASMGPRSDERGNGERDSHRAVLGRASMGPRSDERGNSTAVLSGSSTRSSFNGAALR